MRVDLASLVAGADNNALRAELHGPAGADFVLLVGLPASVRSTPWGDLWIDPGDHVFAAYGTLPSPRTFGYSYPHPALPAGVTVTLQAVLFSAGFQLSSPSVVTAP